MLGIAKKAQGAQAWQQIGIIAEAQFSVAVGGGGTGMDEACALVQGKAAEIATVLEIVFHEKVAVHRRGIGTGAQMDDGIEFPGQGIALHEVMKACAVHIVRIGMLGEIPPLFVPAQVVHHHHVLNPHGVELPQHGAADEAGASGNNVHGKPPRARAHPVLCYLSIGCQPGQRKPPSGLFGRHDFLPCRAGQRPASLRLYPIQETDGRPALSCAVRPAPVRRCRTLWRLSQQRAPGAHGYLWGKTCSRFAICMFRCRVHPFCTA